MSTVLVLPGWQNSGPGHWQSRWEHLHPDWVRVEQHDWQRPRRGDWVARLEEVLLDRATLARPAVLVAHSLGCLLAAAWAGHSRNTALVRGALLVAPPDTERTDVRELLPGWEPLPRRVLPFAVVGITSSNDPFCKPARAADVLQAWGAAHCNAGPLGHLNADSGLGDWPAALAVVQRLVDGAGAVQAAAAFHCNALPPF